MKPSLLVVLGLAVASTVYAHENSVPLVTVLGTAVTEAKPDLLRWQVTISNQGADVAAVAQTHTDNAAALLRMLGDQRIHPEDMQTSGMRISEHREYRASSWIKDGYVASTVVSFTMKNLADYRGMWLGLARLNGVTVDQVSWDVSNRIAVQNNTRVEALKNAKAKAEQMAAALGAKVGEPISIEEVAIENPWAARNIAANSIAAAQPQDEATGDSIAPGTVPIRTRVQVAFRILTP